MPTSKVKTITGKMWCDIWADKETPIYELLDITNLSNNVHISLANFKPFLSAYKNCDFKDMDGKIVKVTFEVV